MKRITILLLAALLSLGCLAACGAASDPDDPLSGLQLYESDTGISLYMDKGFKEGEAEGVTCCFEGSAMVSCREETFASLEPVGYDGSMSIQEYAELLVSVNGTGAQVQTDSYGNVYFIYEQDIMGIPMTYYGYVDKGSAAYWTTNFICPTEDVAEFADKFALWASTITIQ